MPNFSGVWNLKEQIQAIAAGRWTGIATGELYAWGDNSPFGELGDGTVVDKSSPVQIGALTSWYQVSAGGTHTASIKTDGTMWAWGSNSSGQLGSGTTVNKSSPVQIGALTNWAQVSAGGANHTASIKTDGTLWVWGQGAYGKLGDGTVVYKSSPVQVGALTNWAQASAGVAAYVLCQNGRNALGVGVRRQR
jgi:alpha-tubulin suppressor-like RCC1 family protein